MPQCSAEEIQEKPNKKKRWWGDLFRRSNKSRRSKPSDSSSEEEEAPKRGFLGRKRHSDRGSKDVTNSFLINPGLRDVPRGRSLDSVKSPERSSKRRIKAKVEASRELLRDSSSDEASSYTTSSLQSGGGSFPRRSRAARTERHIRRLSRDLEGQNSTLNKSKWSANVVYQECKEYDRKYRAKARSATPSPAQSPKVKRQAARATSFDNIKSSAPTPPPRKLPEQRPLSLDTPMRVYNPPVYTAPPQLRTKSRFQSEFVSEPWLPAEQSPEDAKKPPTAPRKQSSTEERRKQQNNLEEALNELEAIYKKLASEDGQDNQSEKSDCIRPVEDDMAYRRLNKREPSSQDIREIMSQAGSYLLVSPTLSPPAISAVTTVSNGQEPDIINDDVVFRTIQHTNNTLKISDPQPPFGIPLGPISPSPPSDYLHKEAKPRFDYRPAKIPDIDHDDLAFRNLRKDAAELKKKKAVRSLSANLTNLISNNNNFNVQNNNLEGKSYSFQDIPEELRVSPPQHALYIKRRREEEEAHQRYLSELYASENELLRELEEEARATSVQMDKELRQLELNDEEPPSVETALYSRSMTDLINELTKNIESNYDLGFSNDSSVVVANCQTCDKQTTKPSDCTNNKAETNSNHLTVNNNRRLEIAQSRRQFFESQSPHFNRKIERDSSIKLNKNGRQCDKENPFLRYYRSPSNPETSYNEKFVNGYDYRSSRSAVRTSSADSSACKENIQAFIERPFTRTSRSAGVLESSKSFNERHSPKLSRSPLLGLGNHAKPISFSSERDFLDKEKTLEQFSRSQATRSPLNLKPVTRGKLYHDYGRSGSEQSHENSISDLRHKLISPVKMESSERNASLVERYELRGRSPVGSLDKECGNEMVHSRTRLYSKSNSQTSAYQSNKTFDGATNSEPYVRDGLLISNSYQNTLANFDLPSGTTTNTRTHSEDNSFYKVSTNDIDKDVSRSFDSGLMSLIRDSGGRELSEGNNDRSRLEEENLSKTKYLDSNSLVLHIMRSPCAEMMKELSEVNKENGAQNNGIGRRVSPVEVIDRSNQINVKEYRKPFSFKESIGFEGERRTSARRSLSPSVEALQKRKSYAGSADTQIDEHFPREVEHLKPPRSPIDIEAIERDSSSREPSPRHRYTGGAESTESAVGDRTADLVKVDTSSSSSNELKNWYEEDSKQGESQKGDK